MERTESAEKTNSTGRKGGGEEPVFRGSFLLRRRKWDW
jgi:hypothetical protein